MKARHLTAVHIQPAAVPVCCGCKVYRPDCQVPHDDGVLLMCWICAHHFIDHGIALHLCGDAECECLPEAVYPESLIEARKERAAGMVN